MGRMSLIISAVLSFIVSILNLTDHRYINGTIMAIVFVLILIELLRQFRNKTKR